MKAGDFLPLVLQLGNGATGKFPQAYVRDAAGALITGAPFDLPHISLGLYRLLTVQMPDTPHVTVQYIVYSDAGHTVIDPAHSSTVTIIQRDGSPDATESIPVYVQLANNDATKFPQANLSDAGGNTLVGSPLDLTHIANGLYSNLSLLMPPTKFVDVQYVIYNDAGHTVVSGANAAAVDTIYFGGSGGSNIAAPKYPSANIIGSIDSDLIPIQGLQEVINKSADRTLIVRLITQNDGEPMDLSDVSAVEFRFLNADNSVLSIKTSDPTAPVAIISAEAGKISCDITSAQSALLMAQKPAPFSVVLTTLTGDVVVNFPNQLEIQEEAV